MTKRPTYQQPLTDPSAGHAVVDRVRVARLHHSNLVNSGHATAINTPRSFENAVGISAETPTATKGHEYEIPYDSSGPDRYSNSGDSGLQALQLRLRSDDAVPRWQPECSGARIRELPSAARIERTIVCDGRNDGSSPRRRDQRSVRRQPSSGWMSDRSASALRLHHTRRPALKTCAALLLSAIAACAPAPIEPERVAEICEERARAAQGPTGGVTIGTNSRTGGFGALEIGLSSDFLAGRDPVDVYESCVFDRTGSTPIRPPVLR